MNRTDFVTKIKADVPLLMDGAVGTALYNFGVPLDKPIDLLNIEQPKLVADIHRAYIDAGADIIETNTFSANRFKLNKYGMGGRVSEINSAAVSIARRVIDSSFKSVLLAGSIGPLAVAIAPLGRVSIQQVRAAYTEQITPLIEPLSGEKGVDLLILETMNNLQEVRIAVEVARLIRPEIPIVVQMTFHQDDRTAQGNSADDVVWQLDRLDVDVIGINCSSGPAQIMRLLQRFRNGTRKPLAASPNAGWPEDIEGDRVLYPAGPIYFQKYVPAYTGLGVRLIGGCCGTTPEHIGQMREALNNPPADPIQLPILSEQRKEEHGGEPQARPTQFADALRTERFLKLVEMTPPRGTGLQEMMTAAQSLIAAGTDFLTITDLPQAQMRMSAWGAGFHLQQQLGNEVILYFPTRGRSLVRLQADLLAVYSLGLKNIIVILGDRNRDSESTSAENSYDLMPDGLIRLIHEQLNTGRAQTTSLSENRLGQPTNFTIGCTVNLSGINTQRETRLLHEMVKAGATFAISKPIFDVEAVSNFIEQYEASYGRCPPLIGTIQPLINANMVEFLHNEIPGISIPEEIQERMHASPFPQDTGIGIARELIDGLRQLPQPTIKGVSILAQQNRYDLALEVVVEPEDEFFEEGAEEW